jgi:hypothetical protein
MKKVLVISLFGIFILSSCGMKENPRRKKESKDVSTTNLDVFSGKWQTDSPGVRKGDWDGIVVLTVEDNKIMGYYSGRSGVIQGSLQGDTLRGKWWWNPGGVTGKSFEETLVRNRVFFEWKFNQNRTTFTGRSRYDEMYDWDEWNGEKLE